MYIYNDEDNAPMDERVMELTTYSSYAEMKAVESGEEPDRKYCPHRKTCKEFYHVKDCNGACWHECPIYDKIEDHLMEARDNARDYPTKDEIPFDDEDYDGPEVED